MTAELWGTLVVSFCAALFVARGIVRSRRRRRARYTPVPMWGTVVVVTGGRHRGAIGVYDDDDTGDDGAEYMIVYTDTAFVGDPIMVLPFHVRDATDLESHEWHRARGALPGELLQ